MVIMLIAGQVLMVFGADVGLQDAIDDFIQQNESATVSVSVAVFTDNEILLERHHGSINITQNIANHYEAVFEWGSAAKLLVSVSALQLAERGLLDLNGDIRTHVPTGFLTGLSYDEPITMLHLLNHSAGFQETFLELEATARSGEILPLGESLQRFQPLQAFRAGNVTAYSNFGTALAGYVIERISGMPFHIYVQQNIFVPLGMTQTALRPDLGDNDWVRIQRGYTHGYTANFQSIGNIPFLSSWYPAGSATGTLADFAKFGQSLLSDNSPLFQNSETLGLLLSPTSIFPDGTGRNYHGFWAEPQFAGHVIGHAGNTMGFSSTLLIDIANGFGAVVMTNQRLEHIYNRQMMNLIFGESDFVNIGSSANDVRVNGIFQDTRGHQRGMLRFLGLMNIRPFFSKTITLYQPHFSAQRHEL